VDDYLEAPPEWQREVGQHGRDLAHAADPEVTDPHGIIAMNRSGGWRRLKAQG
jgi:hypothetical protein